MSQAAAGLARVQTRTPGKRFILVAGDHPTCCAHPRIDRKPEAGRTLVRCRDCGHSWLECH